jgi:hypothetical protein
MLKRVVGLSIATVFFGCALFASHASAEPPSPPTQLQDTATATGDNLILDPFRAVTDIEVSAHSGPSGENPGGRASFAIGNVAAPGPVPPLRISGPVNCLDVAGNIAVLTIDGPFPSLPGITAFVLRLVDNGGGGLDSFEHSPDDPEVPGAIDCHDYRFDYFGGPLIGRAVVNDVDPLTSKAQCRQGGFARLGFKNQGRCIRYVQRH